MTFEPKPNSGALFKNDQKSSERAPDYKGTAVVDGRQWWIAAWLKEGRNGKYLSLAFEEPRERETKGPRERPLRAERPVTPTRTQKADDGFDSDIPFR